MADHHSFSLVFFFLMIRRPPRSTLFPTRRSSDLVRRIEREHRNPDWHGRGRLVRVALADGLWPELAWAEYPATPGRERRLKDQGSAYRRCRLCRGVGGPLDPAAVVAAAAAAGLLPGGR